MHLVNIITIVRYDNKHEGAHPLYGKFSDTDARNAQCQVHCCLFEGKATTIGLMGMRPLVFGGSDCLIYTLVMLQFSNFKAVVNNLS